MSALAARGQMLRVRARRVSARARRWAALVADRASGPRRPYAGAVRDLVLGVRVVDGTGERPVVRRSRDEERRRASMSRGLMTGALGTLGVTAPRCR